MASVISHVWLPKATWYATSTIHYHKNLLAIKTCWRIRCFIRKYIFFIMSLAYIYKAYVSEYHHKIWPYMVQYLHFRILK